jgi:hypothetical protein
MYKSIKKMAVVAALSAFTMFGCKPSDEVELRFNEDVMTILEAQGQLNECREEKIQALTSLKYETDMKNLCIADRDKYQAEATRANTDLVESQYDLGVCTERTATLEARRQILENANEQLSEDLYKAGQDNISLQRENVTLAISLSDSNYELGICRDNVTYWNDRYDNQVISCNEDIERLNETYNAFEESCTEDRNELITLLTETENDKFAVQSDLNVCEVERNDFKKSYQDKSDDLNRCEQVRDSILDDYKEVDEKLDVIQANCYDISCFRSQAPLGTTVRYAQELVENATFINGTHGDFTGTIYRSQNDIVRYGAEEVVDSVERLVRDNVSRFIPRPLESIRRFWIEAGDERTYSLTSGDYQLTLHNVGTNLLLDINGEDFSPIENTIIETAEGTGFVIEEIDNHEVQGTMLAPNVYASMISMELELGEVTTGTMTNGDLYRIRVLSLPNKLDQNSPFYDYEFDEMDFSFLETRVVNPHNGRVRLDIEGYMKGQVEGWSLPIRFAYFDEVEKKVAINVFRNFQEPQWPNITSLVSEPEIVSDLPLDFTTRPSSLVLDEACGTLTKQFLTQVEGMDEDVGCSTLEEKIITGPTIFSRKVAGNVVTLVTGRDENEIEDAADELRYALDNKGRNVTVSSTGSGSSGSSGSGPVEVEIDEENN